jgi:hypothetical protein
MDCERLIAVEPDRREIEMNPPRLHAEAVQVNDNDDYIREIIRRLAVTN